MTGLPWEQGCCPSDGDVRVISNGCFTMELSVEGHVPEWDETVRLPVEEVVAFTPTGVRPLDGRQTNFFLI